MGSHAFNNHSDVVQELAVKSRQRNLIRSSLRQFTASFNLLEGTLIVIKRCLPSGGFQIRHWCTSIIGTIEVLGAKNEILIGKPLGGALVQRLLRRFQKRPINTFLDQRVGKP